MGGAEMCDTVKLEIPLQDLEFKVQVPDGSRIVAALETPSGQLIRLDDLTVEQGGVPVRDLSSLGGTGPVNPDKIKRADKIESTIQEAGRGIGRDQKDLVEDMAWTDVGPKPEGDELRGGSPEFCSGDLSPCRCSGGRPRG